MSDLAKTIAELRRLHEEATAGPWDETRCNGEAILGPGLVYVLRDVDPNNAHLIATMRNALPDLLDAAEENIAADDLLDAHDEAHQLRNGHMANLRSRLALADAVVEAAKHRQDALLEHVTRPTPGSKERLAARRQRVREAIDAYDAATSEGAACGFCDGGIRYPADAVHPAVKCARCGGTGRADAGSKS